MDTCPECGRAKDGETCGYCLGLRLGHETNLSLYEAEVGGNPRSRRDVNGGGCVLVILAVAILPALFSIGWTLVS